MSNIQYNTTVCRYILVHLFMSITISHSAIVHCHHVQDAQTFSRGKKRGIRQLFQKCLSFYYHYNCTVDCKVRHTHHLVISSCMLFGRNVMFRWFKTNVTIMSKYYFVTIICFLSHTVQC